MAGVQVATNRWILWGKLLITLNTNYKNTTFTCDEWKEIGTKTKEIKKVLIDIDKLLKSKLTKNKIF